MFQELVKYLDIVEIVSIDFLCLHSLWEKTNERNAVITAENLRKTIENHKFHNNIKVTASFGVCECKTNNPTKCLINADRALYNAKNSNRNCVRTHSESV